MVLEQTGGIKERVGKAEETAQTEAERVEGIIQGLIGHYISRAKTFAKGPDGKISGEEYFSVARNYISELVRGLRDSARNPGGISVYTDGLSQKDQAVLADRLKAEASRLFPLMH